MNTSPTSGKKTEINLALSIEQTEILTKYLFLVHCVLIEKNQEEKTSLIGFFAPKLVKAIQQNEDKSHLQLLQNAIKNGLQSTPGDFHENVGIIICEYAKIKALPASIVLNQLLALLKKTESRPKGFGIDPEEDLSFFAIEAIDKRIIENFIKLSAPISPKDETPAFLPLGTIIYSEKPVKELKQTIAKEEVEKTEKHEAQLKKLSFDKIIAEKLISKSAFWKVCREFTDNFDSAQQEELNRVREKKANFLSWQDMNSSVPGNLREGLFCVVGILSSINGLLVAQELWQKKQDLKEILFTEKNYISLAIMIPLILEAVINFLAKLKKNRYETAIDEQANKAKIATKELKATFQKLFQLKVYYSLTEPSVSKEIRFFPSTPTGEVQIALFSQIDSYIYSGYFSQKKGKAKKVKSSNSSNDEGAKKTLCKDEKEEATFTWLGKISSKSKDKVIKISGLDRAFLLTDVDSLQDQANVLEVDIKALLELTEHPEFVPQHLYSGIVKAEPSVNGVIKVKDHEDVKCLCQWKIKNLDKIGARIYLHEIRDPKHNATLYYAHCLVVEKDHVAHTKLLKATLNVEKFAFNEQDEKQVINRILPSK